MDSVQKIPKSGIFVRNFLYFFTDIGVLNTNLKYPTANHFGLDADFYCRGKRNEFQNLFDKSKKLIDSARSNMAEVFQKVMLQECGNFT